MKEWYNFLTQVSDQKIKQYCQQIGNVPYFETSARDNVNVEQAFEKVSSLAFKRGQKEDEMYFIYNLVTFLLKLI